MSRRKNEIFKILVASTSSDIRKFGQDASLDLRDDIIKRLNEEGVAKIYYDFFPAGERGLDEEADYVGGREISESDYNARNPFHFEFEINATNVYYDIENVIRYRNGNSTMISSYKNPFELDDKKRPRIEKDNQGKSRFVFKGSEYCGTFVSRKVIAICSSSKNKAALVVNPKRRAMVKRLLKSRFVGLIEEGKVKDLQPELMIGRKLKNIFLNKNPGFATMMGDIKRGVGTEGFVGAAYLDNSPIVRKDVYEYGLRNCMGPGLMGDVVQESEEPEKKETVTKENNKKEDPKVEKQTDDSIEETRTNNNTAADENLYFSDDFAFYILNPKTSRGSYIKFVGGEQKDLNQKGIQNLKQRYVNDQGSYKNDSLKSKGAQIKNLLNIQAKNGLIPIGKAAWDYKVRKFIEDNNLFSYMQEKWQDVNGDGNINYNELHSATYLDQLEKDKPQVYNKFIKLMNPCFIKILPTAADYGNVKIQVTIDGKTFDPGIYNFSEGMTFVSGENIFTPEFWDADWYYMGNTSKPVIKAITDAVKNI